MNLLLVVLAFFGLILSTTATFQVSNSSAQRHSWRLQKANERSNRAHTHRTYVQIPSEGTFIAPNSTGQNTTYTIVDMSKYWPRQAKSADRARVTDSFYLPAWQIEYEDIIPVQNFTGTILELYTYVTTTYPAYNWTIPAPATPAYNGSSPAPPVAKGETGSVTCWQFKDTVSRFAFPPSSKHLLTTQPTLYSGSTMHPRA